MKAITMLLFSGLLGCFMCCTHCKKSPGSGRALRSRCSFPPQREEPRLVGIECVMNSNVLVPDVSECLDAFSSAGVLHGAVVLITQLCERNPETLKRFRKVWFGRVGMRKRCRHDCVVTVCFGFGFSFRQCQI